MSWVGDTIYIAIVSGGIYLSVRVAYFQLFCTFSPGEAEKDTLNFLERSQKETFTVWESHSYDSTPKKSSVINRVYKRAECGRGIPAILNNLSVSRCQSQVSGSYFLMTSWIIYRDTFCTNYRMHPGIHLTWELQIGTASLLSTEHTYSFSMSIIMVR